MRTFVAIVLVVSLIAGCGGSSTTAAAPAGVAALDNELEAGIGSLLDTVSNFLNLQLILTDPEAAAAAGITFEPDPTGPANRYLFEFPYDSDGDGVDDGTATGTVLLPTMPGAVGVIEFNSTDPYGPDAGTVQFRVGTTGIEVWGSGTSNNTTSGVMVDFTVLESNPLVVALTPGGNGNFCDVDVQGPVELSATGPANIYDLILRFIFGDALLSITDRSVYDMASQEVQPLSDSTMQLAPCRELTIDDWVGTWRLNWVCLPVESGQSTVVFTKTGPDTLQGNDDGIIFTATADAGNPRVLRGFFIDTDSGGTYREDFVLTLGPNGLSWSQDNTYVYTSGPAVGSTGTCGGIAVKQ